MTMATPAALAGRPRVLVADDDEVFQRALVAMFQREGFQVATANDAAQALLRIRAFKPHALLLDLGMPAGGGDGLFAKLQRMVGRDRAMEVLVDGQYLAGGDGTGRTRKPSQALISRLITAKVAG